MEFINHTQTWCQRNIFLSRLYLLMGFFTSVLLLLFWQMGLTPLIKGASIPFMIMGVVYIFTGLCVNLNSKIKILNYADQYMYNQRKFINEEKEQIENFIRWYLPVNIIASVFILSGLLGALILPMEWRGLKFILLALFGFIIICLNYYSEKQTLVYYNQIIKELCR